MSQELVDVYYESITNESPKAYKMFFPDVDNPVWIAKSQIEDHDEDEKKIVIPEWLAIKEGLV